MIRQVAADADRQRCLGGQHAGIGGAVQRRRVQARVRTARPLGHQRAPLLAEHLTGQHQLDVVVRPGHVSGQAGVDDALEERRIAE